MALFKTNCTSVTRKRNDNTTKLLQYANTKRINGEFNDVTIQAGEQSISANRMVLSCYSKFFESMFSSSLMERYQDTVVIQQFDAESIKILIEFIYTGTIDINTENIMSLLATADYLQIDEVKVFCFEFLEQALTVENCLEIAKISTLYDNPPALQLTTFQYICEHFLEIVQEKDFLTLSKTDLNSLISKLDKNKVQETSVSKAILKWVQYDDNRKSDFPELFEKIDLNKLPSDFVADEVAEQTLVKSDLNCSKAVMLYFASKAKSSKTKTEAEQDQTTPHLKSAMKTGWGIIHKGGKSDQSLAEVDNISSKPKVVYPNLPYKVSRHCLVKVNSFIFCIGGVIFNLNKPTNFVFRMNLNEPTLQWEKVASMKEKRQDFGAAAYDGNIVVTGGHNGFWALNSVEVYNVQANHWRFH